jgi:hypothetical protein
LKRSILAFLAALITWVLVASLLNRALRLGIAGYATAEPALQFTLSMMIARLLLGACASLAAGLVAGALAPGSLRPAWVTGLVLLAVFIPTHVRLWQAFPLWYHLTFLVSLLPLVLLGARLAGSMRAVPAAPAPVNKPAS